MVVDSDEACELGRPISTRKLEENAGEEKLTAEAAASTGPTGFLKK